MPSYLQTIGIPNKLIDKMNIIPYIFRLLSTFSQRTCLRLGIYFLPEMKNLYKRADIFKCNFQTHSKFDNRISVYHVLREKKCYPQGCMFFKWHCKKLEKGERCPRGYDHVGRKCFGCKYYSDEKVHYQPQIVVDPSEFRQFEEELEEFEGWLLEVQGNEVSFYGQVESIKPRFAQNWEKLHSQVRLKGWLLKLTDGFIGTEKFEDPVYAHISPHQHQRFRIAPGDKFEVRVLLTVDRGRILLSRFRRLEFEQRSEKVTWTNGQALVARQTATLFNGQPSQCLACKYGALVDVEERADVKTKLRRSMYCLKGISNPQDCYVSSLEMLDACAV